MKEKEESDFDDEDMEFLSKKQDAKRDKLKTYEGDDPELHFEDDDLLELFVKVPPGEGDESMAVKPWIAMCQRESVDCPASWKTNKNSKKPPDEDYHIEWVHGYRTEDTRMNLCFNTEGSLVYPAACLGIVYDFKN